MMYKVFALHIYKNLGQWGVRSTFNFTHYNNLNKIAFSQHLGKKFQ